VLPALVRKFHECRVRGDHEVVIWGSGRPRREFLHVDDLADACLFLLEHYDGAEPINVGTGEDVSISELAAALRDLITPEAQLKFDASMPDGAPRKLLDVSRLRDLGWRYRIGLADGLAMTYRAFCVEIDEQGAVRGMAPGAASPPVV
jgi:GDP-L-fucose synthase